MPKQQQTKAPAKAGLVILMLMGAGAVVGLGAYVRLAPANKVPAAEHRVADNSEPGTARNSRSASDSQEVSPVASGGEVGVFAPVWHKDDLSFTQKKTTVPDGQDPKVYTVNQFLDATKIADPSAKLLSVDIHNGTADLYFNGEFEQTQGSMDEKTLIEGLQRSMGQFPDVQRFRLYANSKPIDTLGNADLSDPIPVIRAGSAASSKPSSGSTTKEVR